MLAKLDALPARHGAYIHNCQSHCQTDANGPWRTDTVNGTHMHAAVAAFYASKESGNIFRVGIFLDFVRRPGAARAEGQTYCDEEPCAGDICNGQPVR